MKIIQGGRGSGKTYTLVQLSHLSCYPIMTRNRCSKKYIQMMADQLGLTIPEPIVFRSKQDTRGKLLPTDKVLVDDLDGWLSDIVSDILHVDNKKIDEYLKGKLQRTRRTQYFDEEDII